MRTQIGRCLKPGGSRPPITARHSATTCECFAASQNQPAFSPTPEDGTRHTQHYSVRTPLDWFTVQNVHSLAVPRLAPALKASTFTSRPAGIIHRLRTDATSKP